MDALALLCTLHADGPATWRRLRENGCQSLAELARFEPAELREIIGGTPASAKRFLREARHLGERSGASWLEREEPQAAQPVVVPEAAPAAELPARDQEIFDDVLRAWREEDAQQLAAAEPVLEPELELEPVAAPAPSQHALEPEIVDGLSEAACERLHVEGVHTLEQLLAADLGALALRSNLGYSRLNRWRALAERRMRAPLAPRAVFEDTRLSPAESPASAAPRDVLTIPARGVELPRRALHWTPLEEGAAGPFA